MKNVESTIIETISYAKLKTVVFKGTVSEENAQLNICCLLNILNESYVNRIYEFGDIGNGVCVFGYFEEDIFYPLSFINTKAHTVEFLGD